MVNWWDSLTAVERIFAYFAIPATLLLLIQTIMLLFGLGHDGDADADAGTDSTGLGGEFAHDAHPEELYDFPMDHANAVEAADAPEAATHDGGQGHDPGLRIFTVRGFVALFSIMGWSGLAMLRGGVSVTLSVALATVFGVAAMLVMAVALRAFLRLQSDGTLDMRGAIGKSGAVYIPIPAARAEKGKISILLQGQLCECSAVTDSPAALKTGTEVTVVGLSGEDTLIVIPKN